LEGVNSGASVEAYVLNIELILKLFKASDALLIKCVVIIEGGNKDVFNKCLDSSKNTVLKWISVIS
jgi:hypothetical protein